MVWQSEEDDYQVALLLLMCDSRHVQNWAPPTGQSGDGKTSLNAKFGY